jgi:UDP-glucose 4-epimerase
MRLIEGAEVVIGDASDRETVLRAVDGADHVLCCMSGLLPAESNRNPAVDAALSLPPLINVLEALRRHPVPMTYLSSGGTAYGNPRSIPVPETAPTDPITSYGIMKLAGEKYVSMYSELYGLPVRILRCSNVYGEGQPSNRGQGAVAVFMQRIAQAEPVIVFGDGSIIRDYIHVSDVAQVVMTLLDRRDGPRILNVGSGVGTSLNDLIGIIESVVRMRARVDRRAARAFDVRAIILDLSILRRMFAFSPMPLQIGIHRSWTHSALEATALVASS